MSDLVSRLRWAATLGDLTTTSARNLKEEAAVRIAELEAEVKGWRNEDKKKQTACEQMVRRIVELENLVAYLCGKNTDHIRVALAGNPTVVDAVVARAEAALEGGKK
jgi:hypothetical protein